MIDDKKIEEAAYRFATSQTHGELLALIDGYKEGYKDAINEFIKDLWHHAEEEPKENRLVLTDTRSIMDKDRIYWATVKLTENGYIRNWSNYAQVTKITSWLYLDDLLPKEGGKQ